MSQDETHSIVSHDSTLLSIVTRKSEIKCRVDDERRAFVSDVFLVAMVIYWFVVSSLRVKCKHLSTVRYHLFTKRQYGATVRSKKKILEKRYSVSSPRAERSSGFVVAELRKAHTNADLIEIDLYWVSQFATHYFSNAGEFFCSLKLFTWQRSALHQSSNSPKSSIARLSMMWCDCVVSSTLICYHFLCFGLFQAFRLSQCF